MAKKITKIVDIKVEGAKGLEDINKQLEDLATNVEKDAAAVDDLTDSVEDLGKEGKKASGDMSDGFSKLPGPLGKLGSAFNTLKGGLKGLTLGFKGLAGAIALTGVGVLVIAVGALTSYFTANEEGANKLKVIMAGLGAVMGNVKDAFAAIVAGDFSKALSSISTEMVADVKAATQLTAALNDVNIAERNLSESRAKTNKQVEQAKLDAKDLTKSTEERAAALQTVIDLETEQTEKELALQRQKVAAIEELNTLAGTSEEEAQRLTDERIKLDELESASIRKKVELTSQLNAFTTGIENERVAKQKEIDDATRAQAVKDAAEAEALAKQVADRKLQIERELQDQRIAVQEEGIEKDLAQLDLDFDRRLEQLNENLPEELELIKLIEEEKILAIQEVKDQYADEAEAKEAEAEAKRVAALEKEVADTAAAEEKKKALRASTIDAALSAASGFASAAQSLSNTIFANQLANAKGNAAEEEKIREKAFKANKAMGIVGAVISTAQAVISGFNAGASLGPAGVVMGPVMAALAAATGIAQIAAIASAKYTPTGGSSGGARPTTPTTPTIPSAGGSVGPNVTFTGSGNDLNTVGGGANQTVPVTIENTVTVSETEITGAQTTVAGYESAASLGG